MARPVNSKPLFQFSIGALMLFVALVALLITTLHVSMPIWLASASLLFVFAVAHVFGNKLGTHLRDHSPIRQQGDNQSSAEATHQATQKVIADSQPTNLQRRSILHKAIFRTTAGGAVIGGILGGIAFWNRNDETWSAWIVGTVSAMVISGILSFLLITFLTMSYKAWSEAVRE